MYTTIIHPLRIAFNLSLNEYCVLDSVYHLSNNNKYGGWCIMGKDNIGKTLDLSPRTVFRILNTLIEKELIEKDNNTSYIRTTDEWNSLIQNKSDWLIATKGENSLISGSVTQHDKMSQSAMTECQSSYDKMSHNNNTNNNIDNNTIKKVNKKKYLDFVLLSEEEHSKLITEYGEEETKVCIEKLNNYIGSTGKKYKSHYFTIRNWMRKEKSTPLSAAPPKKEMSEGQKVYLVQKRAELYKKITEGIETMKDMNMTSESIKTQLNKSFGVEALSLNINLDEFTNNGNENTQTGCLEIQ